MDVKKIKKSIEILKEDLETALLATDIWQTGTGTPIVAYNSNPAATALFEQVTQYMTKALKGAEFPGLDDYYLLKLKGDLLVVVLQFEEGYQWGMLVDSNKVNLGLLLNIAIPNAQNALKEAINN